MDRNDWMHPDNVSARKRLIALKRVGEFKDKVRAYFERIKPERSMFG